MRAEGIRGESLAEGYLKSKGYKIIGRNEKLMGIEVDLIATAPDGDVCFIEVKSRTTYSYGYGVKAARQKVFAKGDDAPGLAKDSGVPAESTARAALGPTPETPMSSLKVASSFCVAKP